MPASAQISATRRRTPCAAEGSATITCRTPNFVAQAGRLEIGPSTLTSSSRRPRFAGSSSISPTTRHCRLRANSRVSRAPAAPAPITSTGSPRAASGLYSRCSFQIR